ncbi:MAG: C-terminal binding protein [Planctomycetota bacterium]|nr:C-terminal binding protein [Planctomycetota bacterium]
MVGDIARLTALGACHEDELVDRIEDANAIMLWHELYITRKTIERLEKCRVIVRCGVGYDNVDGPYARERGIAVVNVPDYGSEEVADSALAMTLSLTRGIFMMASRARAGVGPWSYTPLVPQTRLRSEVFGVVGLGRIGTAAALRAKAFGFDVVFYDPYLPDGADKALGIRRVETLDELLSQSLVVSLHCPATKETHKMIDAAAMEKMRKGAFLVNTARGVIVDTHAVPEALESGHLGGVGLDVLEQEPPAEDHPLMVAWRDPNHPAHHRLIVNQHIAFYSEQGLLDIRTKAATACRRAFLDMPLRNVVN